MATAAAYPTDVKVFIDDEDITKEIFGADFITLDDLHRVWSNIDITSYLHYVGNHTLKVTCGAGVGRVEARISIK